jgi:membrane protein
VEKEPAMTRTRADQVPGEQADTPVGIPPRGWWQVAKRAFQESSADNVPMLAGGVAFFAFLAMFPALIAALTLYGLLADPAQVTRQVQSIASALPQSTQPLLTDQLTSITQSSSGALTTGLVISLLAALWSASGGTGNLITAINLAYDEEESRGFVKLRATALGLTLGAIVFVLLTLTLVAVVPAVLGNLGLGVVGRVVAQVVRWVLLVGVALLTGALVSQSGSIGFVGLILPHAVRIVVGARHRALLPLSALFGATFLVWADTLARTVFDPRELPVGIVTAAVGAPVFAVLLWRGRTRA